MDEKYKEYREKLGEQFPRFLVQGMEDVEITKIIDRCIESGKPYEVDAKDGAQY